MQFSRFVWENTEFGMHAWLVECLRDDRNLPNTAQQITANSPNWFQGLLLIRVDDDASRLWCRWFCRHTKFMIFNSMRIRWTPRTYAHMPCAMQVSTELYDGLAKCHFAHIETHPYSKHNTDRLPRTAVTAASNTKCKQTKVLKTTNFCFIFCE